MSLIIPPGFAQIVWSFSVVGDAEAMVTTCGANVSAAGGDFTAVANKALAAFGEEVMPNVCNPVTLTHVSVYAGQDGGPPVVADSTNTGYVGEVVNTMLPVNCAYLIRKRTDLAGRRGRGRFYLPGAPESAVSPAGVLLNDWVAALTLGFESLRTVMAGSSLAPAAPLVVLHRSEGAGVEPVPTPIESMVCDPKIATQRRRMRA